MKKQHRFHNGSKQAAALAAAAVIMSPGLVPAADPPELASWYKVNAAQRAKVVEFIGGAQVNIWPATGLPNTGGGVATPAYSDIQRIRHSAGNIYVEATGLASHVMGPWYMNAAKTQIFGNWPASQTYLFRIPRVPSVQGGAKTRLGFGNVGIWINGVGLFSGLDTFSYRNASATETPTGDGYWWRSAIAAEAVTFDPAYAHQPTTGQYHYHASPLGLRFQLGDNMAQVGSAYLESTGPLTHSPILGWALDGYPVYGPYGYSDPASTASAIRRMVSGFVERNGTSGTTNLAATGRATLPAWSATLYAHSATPAPQFHGPAVSVSKPLGWYAEDFDYLGDLGFTQGVNFDLDKYNTRFCKTPDYPAGTYAYFTTVTAAGAPAYPFAIGGEYLGVRSGSGMNVTVSESTTTYYENTGAPAGVAGWSRFQ